MNRRATLRQFVTESFFVEDFTDHDSFLRTGIIDSTGMMELILFLEVTFAFKIEDHELVPDNLDSIDKLLRFVERKTARRGR